MNSPFSKQASRGAEHLLNPVPPPGHSLKEQDARVVAQGMGRQWSPLPSIARQEANVALDVSLLAAAPEEPQIVAETDDERMIFADLGPNFNACAVKVVRSQFYGGALALEADITDGHSFGGRPTAEWACADAFLARLREDAARLESECESAPSYALGALQRSIVVLRDRIARIEKLAPYVFSMRRARRQFERAVELERVAREELSAAEASAASVFSAPREMLRRAEAKAAELVAGPSRRHAEALVARSAAEAALKAAARSA